MEIVLVLAIGLVIVGASIGYARALRPLNLQALFLVATPVLSAAICFVISGQKSGYYLAGLMGVMCGAVLLCLTGGMVLGGLIGLVVRDGKAKPPGTTNEGGTFISGLVVYGMSAAAILISLNESGTAGTGHH